MSNYNSALPENNKDAYKSFDTVDFVITFDNQSLQLGSLRLEGELEVTQDGTLLNSVANNAKNIRFDPYVGGHGCVESIQTEMGGEVLENLTEYPRLIKQYAASQKNVADMFNSSNVCELRSPAASLTTELMKPDEVVTQPTPALLTNPDFSLRLDCLLNTSNAPMPYDRTGPIRVSVNLARVNAFLHGPDVDGNTSYSLKDLRLVYKTVPGMDNRDPVTLRRRIGIKQSIQSSLANIQVKVPSDRVEAFSSSFQVQSQENTPRYNNTDLEKLPNMNSVTYLFNDQTNAAITFQLKSNVEVIKNFVEAMGDSGHNSVGVQNMVNNNGYGIGLRMSGGTIDLSNQKFSVQIDSEISNARPLVYYMFFHTLLTV